MIYMDNEPVLMYALVLFKITQKMLTYAYKKQKQKHTSILKFIEGCWGKHSIKRLFFNSKKVVYKCETSTVK